MRWPLLLFSLLYLALLLGYAWIQKSKDRGEDSRGTPQAKGVSLRAKWADLVTDTHRVALLLAIGALLSIAFGKPERILQTAAWIILALQMAKIWAVLTQKHTVIFLLRLGVLALLGLLLILQLPILDAIPR